ARGLHVLRARENADGLLPARAVSRPRLLEGADRRGASLPARDGGEERLRAVPEVLQTRDARLDRREPRAPRAPDRSRAAAPRSDRRQVTGLSGPSSSARRRVRYAHAARSCRPTTT